MIRFFFNFLIFFFRVFLIMVKIVAYYATILTIKFFYCLIVVFFSLLALIKTIFINFLSFPKVLLSFIFNKFNLLSDNF